MAKTVEWTFTSILDRYSIYQFWLEHNKSDSYSQKLEVLFENAARLISEFPEIGTQTDITSVHVKVVGDYKLFYVNIPEKIVILRVWDTRQNPAELKMP